MMPDISLANHIAERLNEILADSPGKFVELISGFDATPCDNDLTACPERGDGHENFQRVMTMIDFLNGLNGTTPMKAGAIQAVCVHDAFNSKLFVLERFKVLGESVFLEQEVGDE